MQESAGRVTEAQTSRLRLADEFESLVLAMSDQLATASTEVNSSPSGLTGAESAAAGMATVGTTVGAMNRLVDGSAAAVDGSPTLATGGDDMSGMAQMAERLRSEATGFVAKGMRR
jgi:hypothetical protein